MKIYMVEDHLHNDDGTEEGCPGCFADPVDITEGVKVLYDLAIGSMDFGSGMWSAEDAAPVAKLGEQCGFDGWENVKHYASEELHRQERAAYIAEYPEANYHRYTNYDPDGTPHKHAFSSQGKCMWLWCNEEGFNS